jgi:hypothetical protein
LKKINYCIDAPRVVRNLFLIAVILFGLAIIFPAVRIGGENINLQKLKP